jgi:hypothetical protein
VQGVLLDQVGAHAGEVTFRQLAQPLKQQVGHRQVEDGIAQELQALVVIGRKAAVRQRTQQQTIGSENDMLQRCCNARQTVSSRYLVARST